MHRNLHRISVHQRLDALGLVSTGQLIRCVNIYFDLAARCLIHELAKLASCLCPGTGFCRGTRKVPGHFRPVQVTVIFHLIGRRIFNARRQIRVIAPLDVLEAPGAMEISPFLGALQGYRWSYSEAEVDHTFSVPLRWFAEHEPERYETELVTVPEETFPFEDVPGGRDYRWRRGHYDVYFYRREEGIIWGMTAKILRSLAEMYREDILLK